MRQIDPIDGDELPPLSESHTKHVERQLSALDEKRAERLARVGTKSVSMKAVDIHGGVAVGWLSEVFNLDPKTVRKRLADCPPISTSAQGPRYSLPQAASYLVKPVFDVNKYLKTMKPEELPPQLQVAYWDMMLKRQKWEEQAGDLWRTAQVRDIFAEVFMTTKSAMQLWSEDLERTTGLSPEQRAVLVRQVDALQEELHKLLIEGKTGEEARSSREEVEIEETFFEDNLGGVI